MKLDIDMRFSRGLSANQAIPPQVADSVLQSISLIAMKFDGTERWLTEHIGTMRLEFHGDGSRVNAIATVTVLLPIRGSGSYTCRIVECLAEFRLGKCCPIDSFANDILDSVAKVLGETRQLKALVAA